MSDCDISAAENVDTTDEGYFNHLLAEKEKQITELQERLAKAEKVIDVAENYIKPYCGVTLNYASNDKLKPACEALENYNN